MEFKAKSCDPMIVLRASYPTGGTCCRCERLLRHFDMTLLFTFLVWITAVLAASTGLSNAAEEPPKKTLFLPKSPVAAAYMLARLSNKELIEAPRSEFVYVARGSRLVRVAVGSCPETRRSSNSDTAAATSRAPSRAPLILYQKWIIVLKKYIKNKH